MTVTCACCLPYSDAISQLSFSLLLLLVIYCRFNSIAGWLNQNRFKLTEPQIRPELDQTGVGTNLCNFVLSTINVVSTLYLTTCRLLLLRWRFNCKSIGVANKLV